METQLAQLVNRLETVTTRLESVAGQKGMQSAAPAGQDNGEPWFFCTKVQECKLLFKASTHKFHCQKCLDDFFSAVNYILPVMQLNYCIA
jgi:hypothetical protein